jgi:5-bromo-4-chloroindolyl phosphate hydrolysis protein
MMDKKGFFGEMFAFLIIALLVLVMITFFIHPDQTIEMTGQSIGIGERIVNQTVENTEKTLNYIEGKLDEKES